MASGSGVPLASLHWGMNTVTTGSDGPSSVADYNANGIAVSMADGSTPPGGIIPAGAQVNLWVPQGTAGVQSGSGGNVATGTQIPIDAANVANTNAGTQATLAGIPIAQQNANTSSQNANTAAYSAQVQAAQVQAQIDDARNQYNLDVAKFGQTQAEFLFNQRLAAIDNQYKTFNAQLAASQLGLDENQFNFNQRSDVAGKKLDIMQLLADRSGPQDWVKYNNLLDQLNAPNPQASTTLDPFSILDGLYDPSNVNKPVAPTPTLDIVNPQPYTQPYQSTASVPTYTGYTPPTNQQTGTTQPQVTTDPQQVPYLEPGTRVVTPSIQVPYMDPLPPVTSSPQGNLATGTSDNTYASSSQSPDDYVYIGGQARRRSELPGMARGGMMGGLGMALVGDQPSGRPTGNEEMVINLNPDPNDRIMVVPMHRPYRPQPGMLDISGVPRAASGGVYNIGDPNTITYSQYSPQDLGNQPFINQIRQGGRGPEFRGFGAELTNDRYGVKDMPYGINLQSYLNLLPTQQAQTKGLYEDALGVNFDDLLEQARRAAPFGQTNPVTRYAA